MQGHIPNVQALVGTFFVIVYVSRIVLVEDINRVTMMTHSCQGSVHIIFGRARDPVKAMLVERPIGGESAQGLLHVG